MSINYDGLIEFHLCRCKERRILAIRAAQKTIRDIEGGYVSIGEVKDGL